MPVLDGPFHRTTGSVRLPSAAQLVPMLEGNTGPSRSYSIVA